jgi:phosphate transport system substrate-binding protein
LVAPGCRDDDELAGDTAGGNGDLSGRIEADGRSTVGPFMTAAAEQFQQEFPDVRITFDVSGTGGGFERFCAGETDLSNASGPIRVEKEPCADEEVEYVEFQVANDALTIVVNESNDWVTCLTVDQLKSIWSPGSGVSNWNQIDPTFPDEPLVLFGAGTASGTFDYFTDAINGEQGASRSDYSATEDDTATVQGVGGESGGMGYVGFFHYKENQDTLEALEIDGGRGCVAPSVESGQSGEYEPLSRPLFVYAKKESFARREVAGFIGFVLLNGVDIAAAAGQIPLTEEQLEQAMGVFEAATSEAFPSR